MKNRMLLLLPLFALPSCTNPYGEDSIIDSTALRSVISQYEEKQDSNLSVAERKKTRIEVEKVERLSATEAQVQVRVQSPTENKLVPVHLIKGERWSVAP